MVLFISRFFFPPYQINCPGVITPSANITSIYEGIQNMTLRIVLEKALSHLNKKKLKIIFLPLLAVSMEEACMSQRPI